MKLKYILTTYDQLDGGARFVQKLSREPFHVMYYQGTVLINRGSPSPGQGAAGPGAVVGS